MTRAEKILIIEDYLKDCFPSTLILGWSTYEVFMASLIEEFDRNPTQFKRYEMKLEEK